MGAARYFGGEAGQARFMTQSKGPAMSSGSTMSASTKENRESSNRWARFVGRPVLRLSTPTTSMAVAQQAIDEVAAHESGGACQQDAHQAGLPFGVATPRRPAASISCSR